MLQYPDSSDLTSIIIVTYNRLDETKRCIDSVMAHTPEPYELLFVDNASSDGTLPYLREHFGHKAVIANSSNEGFLRAANRGMSATRGRYLLLLNNDTTVTPGWLSALHRSVKAASDIGIVGGKIIGPDGRVQVAGAYMTFDGSARMIGEGLPPDDPSLSREREVCYVGGHCMLIRRDVVDAIGLLDEAYGFGYHEDTDYCYRARSAGFRVLYTPDCVVHHQLFGTPLPERQRIIAENQRRFMEQWREHLFLWRSVGPRIQFRADQAELPVGAGWYAAEPEHTYMEQSAWCYLKSPSESPVVLELIAFAPHPDLSGEPLHVEVRANEELVGHAFFNTSWQSEQLFFPVPHTNGSPLRIDLRTDRVWKPDELFENGRDPREIGLAVQRLSVGGVRSASQWAAEGVPVDESLLRLRQHADYLRQALEEKDDFYTRELEGKERLISQLQSNLERYHSTPPFRLYFTLKRLAGRK